MNYNIVKSNFQKGLWPVQMVRMACDKGVITEDEFAEITGIADAQQAEREGVALPE